MKVKFILPALEEATSPFYRPIKYALFPPLGLATLASFLGDNDEAVLVDEHVERLDTDDLPDLVVIQVYITNAYRAYEIADIYRKKNCFVALGGLHVTSLPDEAREHADALFLGPGEESFPRFLEDFRNKAHQRVYESRVRSLEGLKLPRRDLIRRNHYLVPNSIVISRGCPNRCDFCYTSSFFKGGKSFYALTIDRILEEINALPGRHLYFLDDHLFAWKKLARDLFIEMRPLNRLFQGAATISSLLEDDTVELARQAGFRSAFIGFESLAQDNLLASNKRSNLNRSYLRAIRRLDDLGIMINGSFIFGMEHDGPDVFRSTVDWAIDAGIATATFHIMTPYPDTRLYRQMDKEGRITSNDWRLYDTRHLVFRHQHMSKDEIEKGYAWAYREFYKWKNIWQAARTHQSNAMKLKHFSYAGSWKKFEFVWDFIIRHDLLSATRPLLEKVLKSGTPQQPAVAPVPVDLEAVRSSSESNS